MSFIRPEVSDTLTRWREALVGAAATILGGYLTMTTGGAAWLIGMGLLVGGALLCAAGMQRAAFRRGAPGAGVVQVDEGQLAYFGPEEGGIIAVANLVRIDLVRDETGPQPGDRVWILHGRDQAPIAIPTGAKGSDALFDVFAALPGFSTDRMVRALNTLDATAVTLWRRTGKDVGTNHLRLH